MIGIYKIENLINNKVYIGQSIDIKRRWSEHRARRGTNPIYQDMEKLGLDNFSFEVLEECPQEKLDEREIYWIQKYDSYRKGYNQTTGGQFYKKAYILKEEIAQPEKQTTYNIYVPLLLESEEIKTYIQMTNNQWGVYFYLLSMSYYNEEYVKNYRYIFRKDISATEISKKLKISVRTYYNILEILKKFHLIEINKEYILLTIPQQYTDIQINLLNLLLNLCEEYTIDLLRIYILFKGIKERFYEMDLTTHDILQYLGHSETRSENYPHIQNCIKKLLSVDLINLKIKSTKARIVYSLKEDTI